MCLCGVQLILRGLGPRREVRAGDRRWEVTEADGVTPECSRDPPGMARAPDLEQTKGERIENSENPQKKC